MSSSNVNSKELIPNNLLVLVGSGLLLIGLVNILHIVLPPKFGQDHIWEIVTLGKLVGISPLPIIGLSFIFYGESRWTNLRLDKQVTRFFLLQNLSRLSLLLGIGYLSMLLIAANASTRISLLPQNTAKLNLSQKSPQSQPPQDNLANPNDLNSLKDCDLNAMRSPSVGTEKSNLTDVINQSGTESVLPKNEPEESLQVIQAKENNRLLEQIGKWYVEAVVSILVLFGMWYQTDWARNPVRPKRKRSSHNSASQINFDDKSQDDDLDE